MCIKSLKGKIARLLGKLSATKRLEEAADRTEPPRLRVVAPQSKTEARRMAIQLSSDPLATVKVVERHQPPGKFYNRRTFTSRGEKYQRWIRHGRPVNRVVIHWFGVAVSAKRIVQIAETRWSHIKYDIIVAKDGTIYELNPDPKTYASKHVSGHNLWTYGVCLEGAGFVETPPFALETIHSRNRSHMIPTTAQVLSLAKYLEYRVFAPGGVLGDKEPVVATANRKLHPDELSQNTITGHFHHQLNRRDPGLYVLRELSGWFSEGR